MAQVNPWIAGTFEMLYSIFKRDFKDSQPLYEGRAVWFFPQMEDGKEIIFWHMTSEKDGQSGERVPDLRRCERLPWARPMIENSRQPEILGFDYQEADGDTNTYVWLKDDDFVVLMKRYKDGRRRLLTSFYIKYENYRGKLRRKYARRVK
jgi:hypothetical protein